MTSQGTQEGQEYTGLVAVVTGGASGIGLATARLMTRRGGRVVVLDRDISKLDGELAAYEADVTDEQALRTLVPTIAADMGGIDVLVNNAGIGAIGTIMDGTPDDWRLRFDVNVLGPVLVSRAALPYLTESRFGSIVNTCSVAATLGLRDRAMYSATKGAVLALTKAMAADHLSDGVRVNCVAPGTVDTPWVERLLAATDNPAAARAALRARQPIGRLVSADEVAHAIAYLGSPLAASTTGTSLAVDGGMDNLLSHGPA